MEFLDLLKDISSKVKSGTKPEKAVILYFKKTILKRLSITRASFLTFGPMGIVTGFFVGQVLNLISDFLVRFYKDSVINLMTRKDAKKFHGLKRRNVERRLNSNLPKEKMIEYQKEEDAAFDDFISLNVF